MKFKSIKEIELFFIKVVQIKDFEFMEIHLALPVIVHWKFLMQIHALPYENS